MRNFTLIVAILFSAIFMYSKDKPKADDKKELMKESVFSGLKLRNIGPAVCGGRIVDLAVNPVNKNIFYIAVACGGVWKTTNSGISFTPIFDSQKSFSVGCISIDPNNPHVVWVGSGENNSQRSVSYGDGVYKSCDDGKSWKNMGLNKSEHIGKIIIDPKNSDVVYVACQGPLWGPGGDRGLYKTVDGGKTWNKVLDISENTGVSDIAIDPRNSDIIYATSYQRRRHVFTLINGGPEAAIHKSVDAGKTWEKLAGGLPGGELGRIGIAISPVNPDVLYAVIEATEGGGIYRTADRGASWNKVNEWYSGAAQYYQEIFCDPKVMDRIYLVDTYTRVSDDGGKTLSVLGLKEKHVDDHVVWIDPDKSEHIMVGCDGGLYESYDRGQTWRFFENLSITQFYRVTCDNSEPFYFVYGGTQDNNTLGGPSRTTNSGGIMNQDWFYTIGGDGFKTVIDPKDPNILYSQPQYGYLARYDRKSGELTGIQPQPALGEELRWNWDSPVIISPFSNTRLYFASNRLFKTDDRGNSWKAVSPDLTRQIDRNQLKVMGKIWSPEAVAKNASTSLYGNIVSLCESPVKENLIYVGTDDGLIQVTENGGENWTKYETFAQVPETTYVSDIFASQFDENLVYATFDNHKNNDFKPYILKSNDKGKTWSSISGNLPENLPVFTFAEDFVNKNLLFIGTEFGLYFSPNGGEKWFALNNGMPAMSVRDIDIQKRENDLALASFGRGFYILDDYSPLREISEQMLEKEAYLFPVKDAWMFNQNNSWGRRSMGENFWRTPNPDFGAVFTYYLKEAPKSLKDIRKDKEKEAIDKKEDISFPQYSDLRKEDEEEGSFLIFTITDETGNEVRRLKTACKAGINRINWDMRYPDTSPVDDKTDVNKHSGMLILPGKYNVSMTLYKNGETKQLAGPVSFNTKLLNNLTLPAADKKELATFQKDMLVMQGAMQATNRVFSEVRAKIKPMKAALVISEGKADLLAKIRQVETELNDLDIILNGNSSLGRRNAAQTPSITERTNYLLEAMWESCSAPTQIAREGYKISGRQLEEVLDKLNKIINNEIVPLEKELDKANAPWTPGRMPAWKTK
ncbi:MAG: glycosyl hydrolase [Candidatus Kapabacteria bacterium]|nr:glycosyl hydrolase [Candidatus Kapabacteria bacterium]